MIKASRRQKGYYSRVSGVADDGAVLDYRFLHGGTSLANSVHKGPTPTLTRSGATASYWDSSGVLQTNVAANLPRFDHHLVGGVWVPRGLLIEEARTNICYPSETADWATDYNVNSGTASNPGTVSAPDGSATNVGLVTTNELSAVHNIFGDNVSSFTSGTQYVSSCFVQNGANPPSYLLLRPALAPAPANAGALFELSGNGSVTDTGANNDDATIEYVDNGWYRIAVVWTADANSTNTGFVLIAAESATYTESPNTDYSSGGARTWYVWGIQVEAGAFASSPIVTTTTSVTRNQEQDIDFSGMANVGPAGSAYAEFELQSLDVAVTNDPQRIFWLGDSTDVVTTLKALSTGRKTSVILTGGVSQGSSDEDSVFSALTVHKFASTWATNDFADFLDGSLVDTDNTVTTPASITSGTLGNTLTHTTPLCGWFREFKVWNVRKPNGFLTAVTG